MNKTAQINSIVNQIIKCGRTSLRVSPNKKNQCFIEYEKEIVLAMELMPQAQSTFLAVIAKKLKSDDRDKVISFCKNFKSKNFKGPDDPVFLLWRFLKKANKEPKNIYPSVSYAIRSYIKGSKIRGIRNDRSLKELS